MSDVTRLETLTDYANGLLGTREAIERAGLEDFADLLIALAQNDLSLPKPAETPSRNANVERACALLQPRLRNYGHELRLVQARRQRKRREVEPPANKRDRRYARRGRCGPGYSAARDACFSNPAACICPSSRRRHLDEFLIE